MSEHFDKVGLGVDIGGSHISAALVNIHDGEVLKPTIFREAIRHSGSSDSIIRQWVDTIRKAVKASNGYDLQSIGISMPGPFDYPNGISLISGVDKYESLFGLNIQQLLRDELGLEVNFPIVFENDAACFGLGESLAVKQEGHEKVIAITLGTGFGATFLHHSKILKSGTGVPPEGYLYNVPYRSGIAEDYISTRGLLRAYYELSGKEAKDVKSIAENALDNKDQNALKVFELFGIRLGECLLPWITSFEADCLIIGGSISKSASLFLPALEETLSGSGTSLIIKISTKMELAAITGAATLAEQRERKEKSGNPPLWRKTSQALMPMMSTSSTKGEYDIYPYQHIGTGNIFTGYDSLAKWISTKKQVIIDGFVGLDWTVIRQQVSQYFAENNIRAAWHEMSAYIKPETEIETMVTPFLGGKGTVWGKKTTLNLGDFFNLEKLGTSTPDEAFDVNIFIGTGAALCPWDAPVIYFDLPRNELQYRMRAGSATSLGTTVTGHPAEMYKRFYFVDWVVLDNFRQQIKSRIELVADGQWKTDLTWAFHHAIKNGLSHISDNIIRVRPWFEAGAWGGQWMKERFSSLNQDEVNYAWSFELIVPENGLVFESDGNLLEVSFHWLMEQQNASVLGADAGRFGTEFPIRFDFLDTFDGGNLSIQCHPSTDYIRNQFGENFTQDETYYILDCTDDAKVYLGFQDDINPEEFISALQQSAAEKKELDIERFVQKHKSGKHELFLIPNQTIHSSGTNNLVLEISATPYIFTFKMYDWLRLDLNGEPRPINIEHGSRNLDYSRKGRKVQEELISKQVVIQQSADCKLVHIPTHKEHFYDVHRYDFHSKVSISTEGKCHVLMLVEGEYVSVKTKNGEEKTFSYAETFVIPAAAGEYTVINKGKGEAKLIKAFLK